MVSTSTEVSIQPLSKNEWAIPTLVEMNFSEWESRLTYLSESDWYDFYLRCVQPETDSLPTTLVAVLDGCAVGGVSIDRQDDLPFYPQYVPWICCLVVAVDFRGRGIGTKLMESAIERAIELGYQQTFLWTFEQVSMYEALGWRSMHQITWQSKTATVMERDL